MGYNIELEEKQKEYMNLSEDEKKEKADQIKKELNRVKQHNQFCRNKIEAYREMMVNEFYLEEELKILTHNFQKGDFVVLTNKEIAEIESLASPRHYEMSRHDCGLRGGLVTKHKVHEKYILCHVADLCLNNCEGMRYKQRGLRRLNFLEEPEGYTKEGGLNEE